MRGLKILAAVIALHGLIVLLLEATQKFLPTFNGSLVIIEKALILVFAVPAMLLAMPFTTILWKLHLMNAPGWFAWPKPLGFALVYTAWVLFLLGLAYAMQWRLTRAEKMIRFDKDQ